MAMISVGGVGAWVVLRSETSSGRRARRLVQRLGRRVRYHEGRLEGVLYRLRRGAVDVDVSDDVLADRIRSNLGRLEKRLDTPRVHVMVEDREVLLHGEVPGRPEARAIEDAVRAMPGVLGVRSYLHHGLGREDTRPSMGRARASAEASPALRELLDAAETAGAPPEHGREAVRAVLAAFGDRLPADERAQLFAHVPADVRALAAPPRRRGEPPSQVRTIAELVTTAAASDTLRRERAEAITEAVLGRLRQLVPEEADDVAAVLPRELRELWLTAVPG
jgi:uncharacterized protein (DUF2267 family)